MCLNVQLSMHRCSAKPRTKFDVPKLKSVTIQQQLAEKLITIFEEDIEPAPDVDTEWACLRDPLYEAAQEIFGVTQCKHKDYFDKNYTEAMNILDNLHTSPGKADPSTRVTAICESHCGISLLCVAGKILTRIMLNLLAHHIADNVLPESQCGFKAGRGTTDMFFAMRQIQEKCREQNQDFYMVFANPYQSF